MTQWSRRRGDAVVLDWRWSACVGAYVVAVLGNDVRAKGLLLGPVTCRAKVLGYAGP